MNDMTDVTNDVKMIVAVNKTLEPGVALNAASHACLGLMARAQKEQPQAFEEAKFLNFKDASDGDHPFVSARSLIVLRATNGELRKLRVALQEGGFLSVDFLESMTGDTYVEQLARTRQTPEENLTYYAVAAFGLKAALDPLTRKLSLWR